MNLPNLLTLSRLPLMFAVVGFCYAGFPGAASLAFWLFILSALTDWWDGALARRRGQVSSFGIFADALTDKVSVLGILIALLERKLILPESDLIPLLLILLILTREFLITGMRLVAATRGVVVAAEKAGKQKTLMQLIAIGVLLSVPMIRRDVAGLFGGDWETFCLWLQRLGFAFFVLAAFLTVKSGVRYFARYGHLIFSEETKSS